MVKPGVLSLGIHYLPADVLHSLALIVLLVTPFLVAIYYVAIPRLEEPFPLNIATLVLAFVVLFLLCLLLQSFRAFTLVSILEWPG